MAHLSPVEVALHLMDFFPLRDYLAQAAYAASSGGQVPFDPVSLFLALLLRREPGLSWRALARLLGFRDGCTPSPSGVRYFLEALGEKVFEELCCLFIDLMHQAGVLAERSTFPGDPAHGGSASATASCSTRPARGCAGPG